VRSGWSEVKAGAAALAVALGVAAGAGAEDAACTPRTLERGGARFVEVCGAGIFLADAPLACGADAGAACEPVLALAPARDGARPNRPADALVVDGATAGRLCRERFDARLPTPGERARARELGFVSVEVREEPGEFARLRLEEAPEWAAEGQRLARAPTPRPRGPDEGLLSCVAEPALPRARAVPLGTVCDERPAEGPVRSPDCALAAPGGGRFEIGCNPEHVARVPARPDGAAVRCALVAKP
jgi:hypothetical protein